MTTLYFVPNKQDEPPRPLEKVPLFNGRLFLSNLQKEAPGQEIEYTLIVPPFVTIGNSVRYALSFQHKQWGKGPAICTNSAHHGYSVNFTEMCCAHLAGTGSYIRNRHLFFVLFPASLFRLTPVSSRLKILEASIALSQTTF